MTPEWTANNFKGTRLLGMIGTGSENAKTIKQISEALDISPRETARIIADLRKRGVLICGDSTGIYLPKTTQEIRRYYQTARKRAVSALVALKETRKAAGIADDQLMMDL